MDILSDGRVVVFRKELVLLFGENTVESKKTRNQIVAVKPGVYLYDSLDKAWRSLVQQQLCKGEEPKIYVQRSKTQQDDFKKLETQQLAAETLPELFSIDTSELSWFLTQNLDKGSAHGYARLCAWLRFLLETKPGKCKVLGFEDKEALYDAALVHLAYEYDKKRISGQKVTNKLVLKRKIKAYKEGGAASLLSKKVGNKNAEKLIQPQKDLLIQLYSDFKKPDQEVVHRLLNEESTRYGWQTVSLSCVKKYLNEPAVKRIWYLQRHGHAAWRNLFDPIIKRSSPSFANAFWVMDGTPLELYYREGKSAYNRFEIFPVLDAYSWKIVAYSIGRSETKEMVREALRMACKNTGFLPYQLQYDNSSAIKAPASLAIINKLAQYGTPAQVGNARSKVIEPFFKHLNHRVLRYLPNHSGGNVTNRDINHHANKEAIKLHFDNVPGEAAALEQVHLIFATWNHQQGWKNGQSPADMYEASIAATRQTQRNFTEAMDVDAFWHLHDSPILFTNKGFVFTYRKQTYEFDVENAAFRSQYMGDRFQVKFDPEAMDALHLYQMNRPVMMDGKPVVARIKTVLPMAIVDRVAGSQTEYNRLAGLKKENLDTAMNEFEEAVSRLPQDLKQGVTLERVHKQSMNKVRQTLKALEQNGSKAIPLPVKAPFSLYGDEEEGGPIKKAI